MTDDRTASLSRRFARFFAPLTYDALPADVVDKLKTSLLHAAVMTIVGAASDHSQILVRIALAEESTANGATVLVDGRKATRFGAAFANAAMVHAFNQVDSYQMLAHPGSCIFPALLANAELDGADGRTFLTAMAAGYELECRVASEFLPATQARGYRSSPVYGTLGSATAAAKLAGLDEDGICNAIGWATTFAAGTTEGSLSNGREILFQEPNATRNGMMAALLGREPVKSAERSLDGGAGFYHVFTGSATGDLTYGFFGPKHVDIAGVADGLGQRWEMMNVVIKMTPTAGYNIPVHDLMRDLVREHSIDAAQVESVQIVMNWLETSYPSPAFITATPGTPIPSVTAQVAAYSCIHADYPSIGDALDPDGRVKELASRIEVMGLRNHPPFAPRITLRLKDGRIIQGAARGDELKWGFDHEIERLTPIFDQIDWPREKLEGLIDLVRHFEDEPSVAKLIGLCVR